MKLFPKHIWVSYSHRVRNIIHTVHTSDQYRKNTIYSTNELFYSINPRNVEFYIVKDGKWVIS